MKYLLGIVVGAGLLYSCNTQKVIIEKDNKKADFSELEYTYAFTEANKYKLLGNYQASYNWFQKSIEINPNSDAAYYELSNLALATNDLNSAKFFVKQAINLNHNNEWYYIQQARIYLLNNQIDSAEYSYKNLIQYFPNQLNYKLTLLNLYKNNSKFKEALLLLDEIEDEIDDKDAVQVEKHTLLLGIGNYKEAIKILDKLIRKYPETAEYYGMMAELYAGIDDSKNAKLYYELLFTYDKYNSLGRMSYAEFIRNSESPDKFYTYLQEIYGYPQISLEYKIQMLANLMSDQKEFITYKSEIEKLINKTVKVHKGEYQAEALKAEYLIKVQDNDAALKQLRLLFQLDSTNYAVGEQLLFFENMNEFLDSVVRVADILIRNHSEQPLPYLFKGLAFLQKEKYAESIDALKNGLDFVGRNNDIKVEFYTYLADAYHNMNDHYNSDLFFEKVLVIQPDNILVLNNYAYYLSVRNEYLDKALRMSKRTIEKEPNNATYLDTYAWILFKQKKYEEAKKYLEMALFNGGHSSAEINEHFADVLFKLGDKDKAITYWQISLSIEKDENVLKKLQNAQNK